MKRIYGRSEAKNIGVNWNASSGKWQARYTYGGRTVHIGYFETRGAARIARKAAMKAHNVHLGLA